MAEGRRGWRQDANFSTGRSKKRRYRVFPSRTKASRNARTHTHTSTRARKQPVIILSRRGCSICRPTSASPASSSTTSTSSTTWKLARFPPSLAPFSRLWRPSLANRGADDHRGEKIDDARMRFLEMNSWDVILVRRLFRYPREYFHSEMWGDR